MHSVDFLPFLQFYDDHFRRQLQFTSDSTVRSMLVCHCDHSFVLIIILVIRKREEVVQQQHLCMMSKTNTCTVAVFHFHCDGNGGHIGSFNTIREFESREWGAIHIDNSNWNRFRWFDSFRALKCFRFSFFRIFGSEKQEYSFGRNFWSGNASHWNETKYKWVEWVCTWNKIWAKMH